jgi:hypothetical protein
VVDVVSACVIRRPRAEVAAFASEPSNAPRWYVNIQRAEMRTPPPLRVGARIAFRARFLGKTLEYAYEVTELDPGRKLVMRTADGPFPMETTYTWEDAPEGTRMTLRNRGSPAGFSKLAAPFMERAMRSANAKDLARLMALLEAQR